MWKFWTGAACGLAVVLAGAIMVGPPLKTVTEATAQTTAKAPAGPDGATHQALRALIYAGDRAAVAAMLQGLPADTPDAQYDQRQMFSVFSEGHPQIIAFAKAWAEDEPENPHALTARAWSLFSQGWNFRGEGYAREVYPEAMQAFKAAHGEAFGLMQKAVALAPDFLPASDGILRMAHTTGHRDLVAPELARIMDIRPNRFSLTLAGAAHAPQWGGDIKAIELQCRAHAAKVTGRPDYDATVCFVDGLMRGNAMTFDEILRRIGPTDNPMILAWQDRDADIQGETPAEKLAHLDKLKAERPLSYLEANIYDQMAPLVAAVTGEERPLEFPAAVARKVEAARDYADRNPGDWDGAQRLIYAQIEDREVNGTKHDFSGFVDRAIASLAINPYSPGAWGHIGLVKLGAKGDEAANLRAAEPYLVNAAVYANNASEQLRMLGGTKLSLLFRNMMDGVKPADPKVWQEEVLCPMVAQLRLLEAACETEGKEFGECSGLPWDAVAVEGQIAELTSAGLCEAEARAPLESLALRPVQVDLTLN
jgi:hypothetical protein